VISPTQRPLPDITQHSQETNIHALTGGIRTRNRSKWAAVDPRLRPRCHWDRRSSFNDLKKYRKNGVPNGALRDSGIDLFETCKTGTVPKKKKDE